MFLGVQLHVYDFCIRYTKRYTDGVHVKSGIKIMKNFE